MDPDKAIADLEKQRNGLIALLASILKKKSDANNNTNNGVRFFKRENFVTSDRQINHIRNSIKNIGETIDAIKIMQQQTYNR